MTAVRYAPMCQGLIHTRPRRHTAAVLAPAPVTDPAAVATVWRYVAIGPCTPVIPLHAAPLGSRP